jgi:hypothetical protein
MNMNKTTFTVAVFDNATENILHLDLAFMNLKIYKCPSDEFRSYIYSFSRDSEQAMMNYRDYEQWTKDNNENDYRPNLYAFVPADKSMPVAAEVFLNLEEVLLIMFPSDFRLLLLAYYDADIPDYPEKPLYNFGFSGTYHTVLQSVYLGKAGGAVKLDFDLSNLGKINRFIWIAYTQIGGISYLKFSAHAYGNSFKTSQMDMAYVYLCIGLESLTSAQSEITYKISRAVSVINADTKGEGETIYFNMKQFYSLRSAIVHGKSYKRLNEYFFKLQALVSRTIIELITLKIADVNTLDKLLTENGFGSKATLSQGYLKETFNEKTIMLIKEKVDKY